MSSQFSRSELILGKRATSILAEKRVAVFGLGGVGGYVAEALARAGVGMIDIIDSDTVNLTNINRQIIALHSTIGMPKTQAMEQRIKDINPNCKVTKHNVFYLPENRDAFDFKVYDYVVDAVDTVSAKIDIAARCCEENIPLISSMGTGNKLDPAAFRVADIFETKVCPLARVMRSELKKRNVKSLKVVYSEEIPQDHDSEALSEYMAQEDSNARAVPGSVSFVPPVAGLIAASEVIKDMLTEKDV